jgi:hypothetical protein
MNDSSDGAWQVADAWVMAAIAIADQPCSLQDLVAAADGINHAIVMDAEVEHAVRHLVAAGPVTVSDDTRFALTSAGAALASQRRGGLVTQVDSLLKLLLKCPIAEPTNRQLPDGALAAAASEYVRRAASR